MHAKSVAVVHAWVKVASSYLQSTTLCSHTNPARLVGSMHGTMHCRGLEVPLEQLPLRSSAAPPCHSASVASLCLLQVRVGSMSDPAELPGLAHFCEHMLFYSSEKYPVEDEYSRWADRFTLQDGRHPLAGRFRTVVYFAAVGGAGWCWEWCCGRRVSGPGAKHSAVAETSTATSFQALSSCRLGLRNCRPERCLCDPHANREVGSNKQYGVQITVPVTHLPCRFISDHGGHTNAFTAAEDTNYQAS